MTINDIRNKIDFNLYNNNEQNMYEDLERALGISYLPLDVKRRLNFAAYEQGHSSGLAEILNCYLDLAELVSECYKIGRDDGKAEMRSIMRSILAGSH